MPNFNGVWSLSTQYQYAADWPLIPDTTIVLFMGGDTNPAAGAYSNVIEQLSLASLGNSTDFGDLSAVRILLTSLGSATRGVAGGGFNGSANINTIEYVTFSSAGNVTDFGDMSQSVRTLGSLANSTRGVFASGTTANDTMEYITIANTGNVTDFGNLSFARHTAPGCASPTRGLFGNGTEAPNSYANTNVIEYITIASTGNVTDFGDRTTDKGRGVSCSDSVRGLFAGGATVNIIDFVTIATTGNATDFGDMQDGFFHIDGGAASNVHGGISQ